MDKYGLFLKEDPLNEAAAKCRPPLDALEVIRIYNSASKRFAAQNTNEQDNESKQRGSSVAIEIVKLASALNLFHDERGHGYVQIDNCNIRIKSERVKEYLADTYYKQQQKVAGTDALNNASRILEARAKQGVERPLFNRVAHVQPDKIWIDLCDKDGSAICITPFGWRIESKPPPLFRRFTHQQTLVKPLPGGSINELFDFINVDNYGDRALAIAWLAAAYIEDIPHSLLILHGAQGAAKTTAARMLRSLIDPSEVAVTTLPSHDAEFAQILDHHYVPAFDNLTKLTNRQADMLCQAATGGAFSKRELYTDSEDVIFKFRRPMILTGINLPTTAPDLLDRAVLLHLNRISAEQRREEAVLWREFAAAKSRILHDLLDVLVKASRIQAGLDLPRLPRMADFARWGAAIAEVIGFGSKEFINIYWANIKQQVEEVVEDSALACTIRELVSQKNWEGSATSLLKQLNKIADDKIVNAKGWPRDAAALGRALNKLDSPLAEIGIKITKGRVAGDKRTRFVSIKNTAVPSDLIKASTQNVETFSGTGGTVTTNKVVSTTVDNRPHEPFSGRTKTVLGQNSANQTDDKYTVITGEGASGSVGADLFRGKP